MLTILLSLLLVLFLVLAYPIKLIIMDNSIFNSRFTPSLFSDLQVTNTKRLGYKCHRDVYFLLQEKVLESLDEQQLKNFLSDARSRAEPQVSDDILFDCIRSRGISELCEFKNYYENAQRYFDSAREEQRAKKTLETSIRDISNKLNDAMSATENNN